MRQQFDLSEAEIQKAIQAYLQTLGWIVLRVNSGMIFGGEYTNKKGVTKKRFIQLAPRGTSDLICCSPSGHFVAIEVKRPGQAPRSDQKVFLKKVSQLKGVSIWVSSLDELIEDLKSIKLI